MTRKTDPDTAEWDKLRKQAQRQAKRQLFAWLLKHRIAFVDVEYDGYGDSGQVEQVTFLNRENQELKRLPEIEARKLIDRYLDYLLPQCWEDGNGACGTVRIDVAQKKAHVEHNERYEDYETSEWED